MHKLTIGWMYPDLLNLHGERGSVQALEKAAKDMGLEVDVRRIEDFDDPIPFDELDMLIFLPGEIASFYHIASSLRRQIDALRAYIEDGNYIIALGTTGLMFGNTITREDGSTFEGLGILDLTAIERKYVWGDDLHFRIKKNKQQIVGSQITMADVDCKMPLGTTIYGRGNNGTGCEGGRYKNLIYTNCQGPVFVKNPWWAEDILKDTMLKKLVGISPQKENTIASDSFDATLKFIQNKPKA